MDNPSPDNQHMREQVLAFLKKQTTMVIATLSPSGTPEAATVYYVVDDAFRFYFLTSLNTRKSRNLSNNKTLAFVVGTGPAAITLQGEGTAELLDAEEADVCNVQIETHAMQAPAQWPLTLLVRDKTASCTFRITPTKMRWLNLDTEHYPESARDDFYSLM